ncbi:MAG: hypothetical protein NVSMB2_02510 [Chloroflexota bacterium]
MQYIIFGHPGSDAGYWYIGADGQLHHVGGWEAESLREVSASLNIIREATRLRTPGLAEAAIQSVLKFTDEQLGQHLKNTGGGAGVVIVA